MHPRRVLCILVLIIYTGRHAQTCTVSPTDPYLEMGSDIEMICQNSCSPGEIYWKLNHVRIDDSLSKTFNSSNTILQLKNFTRPSDTLLECISYRSNQILGGSTIKTYSKPSKISCILEATDSWYLPDVFICSWEHPMNSSLKIKYTVSSQCPSCEDKSKKICITSLTSCKFNTSSLPKIGHDIFVTVTAETASWEAHSDIYTFKYYQILKMKPPDISVKEGFTGKNHLLVKLDRKDYGKRQVIHYQVKYSKAHNGTKEVINDSINLKDDTGNVTINVESCIVYKVSARWALEKAPWSNWSKNKIVWSKLNKSAINLGLWRKVDEPEINGIRKVHAMWTEIPPTCEGEFHYSVHSTLMDGMNYTEASCGPSTCETDVNHNAHRITLTVFHNGTLLANESTYIPAIGERLPQVDKLHTSTHEGYILVSWKAPSQPVSGYMIDWTHNGSQYFWKESKYTNTTISKLVDFTPYNITVTPLLDHKTGLGTQASQICYKRKAAETISFTNVVAKDKSALVSWTMEPERQCSDVVVSFTVFYGADKGPLLNATVDGTKQEVLLEDLKPDTHYVISVTAIAITRSTSSSDRHFETKKYDPSLIAALSIYGSVAIVLVLSFGLCCAFLWKKFRDKMVPNPGLSSLVLWLSQSHQKPQILQPFSTPYESHTIIETVYPCEPDTTTAGTGGQATAFDDNLNANLTSDQAEEKTDLASFPTPVSQEESPVEMVETPSPQESVALLASESGPRSPYRSQSSAENSELSSPEQCTHLLGLKQQSKTAPMTVYVTLDMFEQGQDK